MALSVMPIEKTETITPTITAICCFQGVAPIRNPVLRSCDVSPALAAAMHTTPPIVIASAPNAGAVQPFTRKIAAVAMRVAIVMPEMGFAELPINPTMREDTVTKRKPKTTTRSDAAKLASHPTCAPGTGLKVRKRNINKTSSTLPPSTTLIGRSRSVRLADAMVAFLPKVFTPALSAPRMVGMVLSKVMRPEAATAPAPMGRTYVRHRSLGDICEMGTVPG